MTPARVLRCDEPDDEDHPTPARSHFPVARESMKVTQPTRPRQRTRHAFTHPQSRPQCARRPRRPEAERRRAEEAADQAGVPRTTLELVNLRASQINGCAVCLDMHSRGAKKAGETDERLATLPAWRDAPYFTDAERAALALAEAGTRLADRGRPGPRCGVRRGGPSLRRGRPGRAGRLHRGHQHVEPHQRHLRDRSPAGGRHSGPAEQRTPVPTDRYHPVAIDPRSANFAPSAPADCRRPGRCPCGRRRRHAVRGRRRRAPSRCHRRWPPRRGRRHRHRRS